MRIRAKAKLVFRSKRSNRINSEQQRKKGISENIFFLLRISYPKSSLPSKSFMDAGVASLGCSSSKTAIVLKHLVIQEYLILRKLNNYLKIFFNKL